MRHSLALRRAAPKRAAVRLRARRGHPSEVLTGFGLWELLHPAIATPVVYLGLGSYRFIALAWLMHSGWDVVHHFWGNPIWPFMATSSFGCMIFDMVIAIWFLAGAPSVFALRDAVPAHVQAGVFSTRKAHTG